jgi:hypothetical protein
VVTGGDGALALAGGGTRRCRRSLADRIFGRTRDKAAAVDTLRRSLNKQLRLREIALEEYTGLSYPSVAFAQFVSGCEQSIDRFDQHVVKQNKRLLGG